LLTPSCRSANYIRPIVVPPRPVSLTHRFTITSFPVMCA
jgi:hypothetical protein